MQSCFTPFSLIHFQPLTGWEHASFLHETDKMFIVPTEYSGISSHIPAFPSFLLRFSHKLSAPLQGRTVAHSSFWFFHFFSICFILFTFNSFPGTSDVFDYSVGTCRDQVNSLRIYIYFRLCRKDGYIITGLHYCPLLYFWWESIYKVL